MKDINVIIVGLGGIGGIVADGLWPFLRATVRDARLRQLVFIDKDQYEQSNVARQKAAAAKLGLNKAFAWETIYSGSKYNNVGTTFKSIREWVTPGTISSCFDEVVESGPTIVMSCVDNHPARYLMSQYIQRRVENNENLVIIQGGCTRNRATTDLFGRWNGVVVGTPIEVNHPEVKETKNGDRNGISCEELANSSSGDQTYVENYMAASMMMHLFFTLLTSPSALTSFEEEFFDIENHYYLCNRRRPAPPPGAERRPAGAVVVSVDAPAGEAAPAAPATNPALEKAIATVRENHAALPLLAALIKVTTTSRKAGDLIGIAEAEDVGAFLVDIRRRKLGQEVIGKTLSAFGRDGAALMHACVAIASDITGVPGDNYREKMNTLAKAAAPSDMFTECARDCYLAAALTDSDNDKSTAVYDAFARAGEFDYRIVMPGGGAEGDLSYQTKHDETPSTPEGEALPEAADGEAEIEVPGDFGDVEDVPQVSHEELDAMTDDQATAYIVARARAADRRRERERRARQQH